MLNPITPLPSNLSTARPVMLLAEDSDDDAYFFERELRKSAFPCSIKRAVNGKLAIAALEEALNGGPDDSFPALVFLDLKMPVMSGFEVLEWIQRTGSESRLQVVVLSGSNDGTDRQRAAALGARDYLVKPVTAADLGLQFKRLLGASLEPQAGSAL